MVRKYSESVAKQVQQLRAEGKTYRDIGITLGINARTAKRYMQRARKAQENGEVRGEGRETVKSRRGVSRQEFAQTYDFSTRTRVALRLVVKTLGSNEYVRDNDIRQECGASGNGWRTIAEEAEFLPYQFKVESRVFWSSPRGVAWALENVAKARSLS